MARRALMLVSAALLGCAPSAFAAAGGGSSGFSGGGGGGGGYSGGGGGGFGGGGSGTGDPLVFGVIVGLVILFFVGAWIWVRIRRAARKADRMVDDMTFRRRYKGRGRQVELAAAEAAADDESFAVARVREDAELLFRAIQGAWSRNDYERLHELVGPELMVEWERRLKDFRRKGWKNKVEIKSPVEVAYVGLVNREGDEEDRVVVRVAATLDDYVVQKNGHRIKADAAEGKYVQLREWWTLGKRADRWTLLSIEQREEGEHHLAAELVAAPEHDARLADESLTELAVADKVADGFEVAEIADLDFEGSARDAALDLALADARFAPDVLEIAARRAVAAWAEAVDGEDEPLERVATPEAVGALLYGGDASGRTRLVVRGPAIKQVRITGLDAAAEPARMSIEVDVNGTRYMEDRDTVAVVSGSKDSRVDFTERWTLALSGSDDHPWQIVEAGDPRPTAAA